MLSGLWSFILLRLVVIYHVFSMLCTSAILYSIEVRRDGTFNKGPLITRNKDMTRDVVPERAASCEVHLALTRKRWAPCSTVGLGHPLLATDPSLCHILCPTRAIKLNHILLCPLKISAPFTGFLFTNPETNKTFAATSLPDHIDPTVTYIAKHPFLAARLEGYSHNQV